MIDSRELPNAPYLFATGRTIEKPLFKSGENIAAIETVPITPGFGALQRGTLLAKNISAAGRKDLYVPYVPDEYTDVENIKFLGIGRTFLVADCLAAATTCKIKKENAGRFVVGDDLVISDSSQDAVNLGAIISLTEDLLTVTVEFTTVPGADFLATNKVNVYVEQGDTTATLSTAVGILTQELETGDGILVTTNVPGSMVYARADLSTFLLQNLDAQALTDLYAIQVNDITTLR